MKEGLWVESEASGWRKAESGAVGGESGVKTSGWRKADMIRWVGGADMIDEEVKKAESAGELVTKAESADEEC